MNKRDFKRFYDKNFDRIYRFVYFRVGADQEAAEDLVSEIFIKALEKFHTYDPAISASAWIYTIAKNHLANYFRSKYFRDVEPLETEVWWQDNTWELIDREKDKQVFFGLLKQLNDYEQRLVTLKYIEGYNYREMSEILDKPKIALRVATHRAINKLKTLALTYELKQTNQKSKVTEQAGEEV